MSNLDFGFTMTIFGIGITLITLYVLTILIHLLNRFFPHIEEKEEQKKS
jgi:Na+-transporting methylmalonyl-CoA/oxaloacetate decarboxylase gamma subunit